MEENKIIEKSYLKFDIGECVATIFPDRIIISDKGRLSYLTIKSPSEAFFYSIYLMNKDKKEFELFLSYIADTISFHTYLLGNNSYEQDYLDAKSVYKP